MRDGETSEATAAAATDALQKERTNVYINARTFEHAYVPLCMSTYGYM